MDPPGDWISTAGQLNPVSNRTKWRHPIDTIVRRVVRWPVYFL